MMFIYAGLILFGFLPMGIILYKKHRLDKLRKFGIRTTATVSEIYGVSIRMINLVSIEYPVKESGETITKNIRVAGVPYSIGDKIPVIYDPKKPRYMEVDAKKSFIPMLIFTLLIAGFVIWACFKINQGLVSGQL